MKRAWLWPVTIGIWLLYMLGAFFLMGDRHLRWFDPEQKLTAQQSALQAYIADLPDNTVIEFVEPGCYCNPFSSEHREELRHDFAKQGKTLRVVTPGDEERAWLPSAPAVLVVGENKQIVYLGPYSAGLYCSANNSFVVAAVNNYQRAGLATGILDDAQGCYCRL
ncbi:DUF6436 domain-containing protein [Bowmanella yangjiangensis]|uniref:DUF6436 domain-containing protein n=1 Tax=Bowmanella yangjiangensis TaxID=2811230 RepID=A0ABS3CYU5_9ALTE|nr:hypothetical protein [Bowmanella yangjiangensis]